MPKKEYIRIEIHLLPDDVAILDKLAAFEGRSRKNFCEQKILATIVKSKPISKTKKL